MLVLVRPIYHAAALYLSQTDRASFLGGLDQAAKSRHVSGVGGESETELAATSGGGQ